MSTETHPKPLQLLRDAAPPLAAPAMLTPHHVEPQDQPRNCVRKVVLGDRVLLMSFDAQGAVVERYEGPAWLVTDLKLETMEKNLAVHSPAPLHLL